MTWTPKTCKLKCGGPPGAPLWLQVVAHSVGTWIAYELLRLARSRGLPMPTKVFVSAMASPDIADAARPWRQQSMLSEAQFQVHSRVDGHGRQP